MNNAEELAAIQADLLRSLVGQEESLRRISLHVSVRPLDDAQRLLALEMWQRGAGTMIRVADLPDPGLPIIEALEGLGDALDDVRKILTAEGVG